MKKLMWSSLIVGCVVCFFLWIISPDVVNTHYNLYGEVDGTGSKNFILLFPLLMIFMTIIMYFSYRKSPKKEITSDMQNSVYFMAITLNVLFTNISLIFYLTSLPNFINSINNMFLVVFGVFIIMVGYSLFLAKTPNKKMGYAFSWTLNNQELWDKTRSFGFKTSIVIGLAMIIYASLVQVGWVGGIIGVLGILACFVIPSIYSYSIYKRTFK